VPQALPPCDALRVSGMFELVPQAWLPCAALRVSGVLPGLVPQAWPPCAALRVSVVFELVPQAWPPCAGVLAWALQAGAADADPSRDARGLKAPPGGASRTVARRLGPLAYDVRYGARLGGELFSM
jgi:hypothetical protein